MSYQIDMINITKGRKEESNFGTLLLRLIMKADQHNLRLLQKGFPNAVETVEHWLASPIEEILDLPYD
jgi:hypothetical protein